MKNARIIGHFVKRISKVIMEKGLENIKENKERIPQIIINHKLKIQLDKDNKIVYEEEYTKEILDLLLDLYVTSELTDKKGVARSMEYEGE